MKKLLLLLFISFLSNTIKSQVVFCPPGAEWRYIFGGSTGSDTRFNITYIGDSIHEAETVKVLQYSSFFKLFGGKVCQKVLIKQKGDTIFMRNCNTADAWEILYNFAATAGQQWITTVKDQYSNSLTITHTIVVNSVSTVTINNQSLKKLSVSFSNYDPFSGSIQTTNSEIIERIGSTRYLFNYANRPTVSDYPKVKDFLCYKDNTLGTADHQTASSVVQGFSQKGCEYAVGISESTILTENLKIYPQPAANALTIALDQNTSEHYSIQLVNLFGQLVIDNVLLTNNKTEIDLSSLSKGIYFLQVFDSGKPVAIKKIIKA